MSTPDALLFIHGYNSSPASHKATLLKSYLAEHFPDCEFLTLQVSNYPDRAFQQLKTLLAGQGERQVALVGSSMGGFYATLLAEKYGLKAVLVNPAVNPSKLIVNYLGENTQPYTGEVYTLEESHIQWLRDHEPSGLAHPENLLLLTQSGDEVLDYNEGVTFYADSPKVVGHGGSHHFENFEEWIPYLLRFLGLQ